MTLPAEVAPHYSAYPFPETSWGTARHGVAAFILINVVMVPARQSVMFLGEKSGLSLD